MVFATGSDQTPDPVDTCSMRVEGTNEHDFLVSVVSSPNSSRRSSMRPLYALYARSKTCAKCYPDSRVHISINQKATMFIQRQHLAPSSTDDPIPDASSAIKERTLLVHVLWISIAEGRTQGRQ